MIKKAIEKIKNLTGRPKKEKCMNYKILQMAASQIGVLEWKDGSNPVIEKYYDYATDDNSDSPHKDDVPWCSAFVCWVLEKCGRQSTNSLMARSYERWGVSVKQNPLPGDIVTFYRGEKSKGFGHVGFFVGFDSKGHVIVLGGNQNDAVNVTSYSAMRMTDIRRSSKAGKYDAGDLRNLIDLKEKILNGIVIKPEGSVV
jgi:uncharacterized protein (TIGR02594 family)